MLNSLLQRLLLSSILWSLLGLAATGLLITSLYRNSIERSFDSQLDVYLKILVAEATTADDLKSMQPPRLPDPRFSLVLSGYYWRISAQDDTVLLTSRSLFAETLPSVDLEKYSTQQNGTTSLNIQGPAGRMLRMVGRSISMVDREPFTVFVAGDAQSVEDDIALFRNRITLALSVLGFVLALSTYLQVKWGLRPLRQITEGLNAIRSGNSQTLKGRFPNEVEPLVNEINALIAFNNKVVERARTHVGNLAHAMKTPISVLNNEVKDNKTPLSEKLSEQLVIMQRQLSYHLDRARIAAKKQVITAPIPLEPVIAALMRTMEKIHRDKKLSFHQSIRPDTTFIGERQDIEEVLGNLLDNACKWARTKVLISAHSSNQTLTIIIEDDGSGLTSQQIEVALRRGERLDEQKPGSGLGLSIVCDMIEAYDGALAMGRSEEGGLKTTITLPIPV